MARLAMRTGWTLLIGIGVLFAVLIVGLAFFDWNQARGYVEQRVSERTGRSFAIQGGLDVDLSLAPRIRMEKVVLGNAPWGSRDVMAQADIFEFRVSLWPLLFGRLILPEIVAVRPDVLLERGPLGEPNWELAPAEKEPGRPPSIGRLAIHEGEVRYRNPQADTDLRFRLDTTAAPKGGPALAIRGEGKFGGDRSAIEGSIGSLLSLRPGGDPYPINLKGHVGGTYFDADGIVAEPIRFEGVDLRLELKGPDLAEIKGIVGIPAPATPPYDLAGQLKREGPTWSIGQLSGRVGDSDLVGNLAIDLAGRSPFIRANLRSRYLDIDDLAGLIKAPPQTGPGETASPKQRREAARMRQRGQLLPDRPYDPAALRAIEFDVELRGERVKSPRLPLDDLHMHAVLRDGQLTFEPLNFGVAGGNIVSTLWFDARDNVLDMKADVTLRTLQLAKLFPRARLPDLGEGRFGGRAQLTASGNSLATLASRLDGDVGIAIAGGQISNLLLELAGIDVAEAAKFFLGDDKQVPIRCGVADFEVQDGEMRVEALVLDTADTKFQGEGAIRLGPETFDLTIHARPKDPSILSARAPLQIGGRFTDPELNVKGGRIAAKGAAALALGAVVGPLAALVPLIETGPGENADCRALIAQAGAETAKGAGTRGESTEEPDRGRGK